MVSNPLRYLSNLVLQQSTDIQKQSYTSSKLRLVSNNWTQFLSIIQLDHSRHPVPYFFYPVPIHWTLPKVQFFNTKDRSNWRPGRWLKASQLLCRIKKYFQRILALWRNRLQSATSNTSDKQEYRPQANWENKFCYKSKPHARRAQLWHLDKPSLPTKVLLHSMYGPIQIWLRYL